MDIKEFQKNCHQLAKEKGWWKDGNRNFGELIALCHSELSEAFEEYRNDKGINETYFNHGSDKPEGIPTELADLIIRILDFCEYNEINMESVLRKKFLYNCTRSYRHGNKIA